MSEVDVKLRSTLDFGDLGGRLNDAERKILVKFAGIFSQGFKKPWRGWEYKDRPKSARHNVSQKEWNKAVETREGKATMLLWNHARDWRHGVDPYVAYVHRAGTKEIEWSKRWKELREAHLKAMAVELAVQIAKSLFSKRSPSKIRKERPDVAVLAETAIL